MLAHEMDVDIWEVLEASATKPFGFQSFMPGIGPGGQCIPVNPYYISWKAREFDFHTSFIELAGDINLRMANYVMHRIHSFTTRLGIPLAGANVLCLGAAFKAGVSDVRNSRAVKVMELLHDEGAHVRFADPLVTSLTLGGDTARRGRPRRRRARRGRPGGGAGAQPGLARRRRARRGHAHVRRGERARAAVGRHARAAVTQPPARPRRPARCGCCGSSRAWARAAPSACSWSTRPPATATAAPTRWRTSSTGSSTSCPGSRPRACPRTASGCTASAIRGGCGACTACCGPAATTWCTRTRRWWRRWRACSCGRCPGVADPVSCTPSTTSGRRSTASPARPTRSPTD